MLRYRNFLERSTVEHRRLKRRISGSEANEKIRSYTATSIGCVSTNGPGINDRSEKIREHEPVTILSSEVDFERRRIEKKRGKATL